MEIKSFSFNNEGRKEIEKMTKGKNWPVVYMLHNKKDLYIGETTSAYGRISQHLQNPEKSGLTTIQVVFDDTYNKSVILDFEQRLIKYTKTDRRFKNVLNKNVGQSASHNYYQRDKYEAEFQWLWKKLIEKDIAIHDSAKLENENIFKYSPYNSLTEEQNLISIEILNNICDCFENNEKQTCIVNGGAGTGKTVMAISIIYSIVSAININETEIEDELSDDKIKALIRLKKLIEEKGKFKLGFVFPMTGIRNTIKKVFHDSGNGLTANMVISPNNVIDEEYDILFVDESHRLCKRKNIVNMASFDKTCRTLGLDKNTSNQLDWILLRSKCQILFYDVNQTIKGADITYDEFQDSLVKNGGELHEYQLTTQMRCKGGDSYVDYVQRIMNLGQITSETVSNYDFKIFDNVDLMVNEIKRLDKICGLCRNVAGYSWKWTTKGKGKTYKELKDKQLYDIEIDKYKYIWNLKTEGWILRDDAIDTIGCIHTTQGYDLNYVGVIFGKEIDYNPLSNTIEVDLTKFYDTNVKRSTPPDVVKQYIINTYTTMMTRGIKGCYVYACNKNMQNYLKRFISSF